EQLGGAVSGSHVREFGYAQIKVEHTNELFKNVQDHVAADGKGLLDVWMSHGDKVTRLPEGFVCIASTSSCPIAAMAAPARHFYGVQFHPEVTHTLQGARIFEHFLFDLCHCEPLWTP